MSLIRVIFLFILICIFYASRAQFFLSGEDPSRLQWDQIQTRHFRIVYPRGSDSLAWEYLRAFEDTRNSVRFMRGIRPGRLDVLLHTLPARSNAWLAWAPSRLEVLTVPPQDMYAHPWQRQLALHELRHDVQMRSMYCGFTKWMSWGLGQQAAGLSLGLHIPLWLLEGDAVWAESVFSDAGRLRDPWFRMPLLAQWSAGRLASYEKAYLGSYRDFVPDHYILGAAWVEAVNMHFGHDTLYHALQFAASYPFLPGAFSRGLRQATGLGLARQYEWVRNYYAPGLSHRNDSPWHFRISGYCDEIYPAAWGEGWVYIRKQTGRNDQWIYRNSKGEEKAVYTPGYYDPASLSICRDKIAFTEYLPGMRWEHAGRNALVLFSLQDRSLQRTFLNPRFYSPALNPKHDQVAGILIAEDATSNLAVYGLEDHTLLWKTKAPPGILFSRPVWDRKGESLFVLATGEEGKAFFRIDPRENRFENLTGFTMHPLEGLAVSGDTLWFAATWEGKGQIMAFRLTDLQTFVLTQETLGAAFPEISRNGSVLAYSGYTSDGYRLRTVAVDSLLWQPVQNYFQSVPIHSPACVRIPESSKSSAPDLPAWKHSVYPKWKSLWNIHSYGPVSVSASEGSLNPGFTLASQNLLGTMIARGGYEFDVQESEGKWFADLSYRGWYPVIGIQAFTAKKHEDMDTAGIARWREDEARLSISLPLRFSSGPWSRSLTFWSRLSGLWQKPLPEERITIRKQTRYFVDYLASFSVLHKTPVQNLVPTSGLVFRGILRTSPLKGFHAGGQYAAEAWLYQSLRNHPAGLVLYLAHEDQTPGGYTYSRLIRMPRGYTTLSSFPTMNVVSLTVNLPLLYPDAGFSPLVYFKRIYTGLFVDYGFTGNTVFWSTGSELLCDFHLFRNKAPVKSGIRLSWNDNEQSWRADFLFRMDFVF